MGRVVIVHRTELASLVGGCILLVVGIVMMTTSTYSRPSQKEVKQLTIPVQLEDFKSDPAVYDAIQKQLGNQDRAAPTPQTQPGASPQDANSTLQSTATGLQAR